MADESHVIRGIDWKTTFPFTQIFRSFRIAIHPSKIILALLTMLLIWFGGWFLDRIWPVADSAVPGELARVTGLSRPDAGLGNRALVKEGYAVMLSPGSYRLADRH